MKLKNLKVGTRLGLASGFLLWMILVNGVVAIVITNMLNSDLGSIAEDTMPKIEMANKISDNINLVARVLRNIVIYDTAGKRNEELKRVEQASEEIGKHIEGLKKASSSKEDREMIQALVEARSPYLFSVNRFIDLAGKGNVEEAKKLLLSDVRSAQNRYFEACGKLIGYHNQAASATAKKAKSMSTKANVLNIALVVAALVNGSLSNIYMIRSVTGPVAKTVQLAESMAKGDLTASLPIDQDDELGQMARSLNGTLGQMRSMIGAIKQDVNALTVSSADLAAVSQQLSSAANETAEKSGLVATATEGMNANIASVSAAMEQSASNFNMVASATEEMTATIAEISQNAERAREVSEKAVGQSRATSEKSSPWANRRARSAA